jgi:hypothetical protein
MATYWSREKAGRWTWPETKRAWNNTKTGLITLGLLGMPFAFLLREREVGPHGHGLETITASNS